MTPMSVHGADDVITADRYEVEPQQKPRENTLDVYFSADVETDGPIPGPFSMLSFALVYAGAFDGNKFTKPARYEQHFYCELKPISDEFDIEALRVNGMDRDKLLREGQSPKSVMQAASEWVQSIAGNGKPVLVAYPLSFDWSWLYWYFIRFCSQSPFNYSRCFDIKTAFAVKAHLPIADAGRSRLEFTLPPQPHAPCLGRRDRAS
jgi:hypothetical protein